MAGTPTAPNSLGVYFGIRLRHWREQRRITQVQLGGLLGYVDSHISKIESGERWPPAGLAKRCDELLDTGGELSALWPVVEQERAGQARSPAHGGDDRVTALTERAYHGAAVCGRDLGMSAVHAFRELLTAYRQVDNELGGAELLEPLEQQTKAIIGWQAGARGPVATALLGVAAEYAEMTGWIHFDRTGYATALMWYDCGYRWALAAGDPDTASQLLARKSTVCWEVGDAQAAIELARAAQSVPGPIHPGVRAWAALAEARGQAAIGNRRVCERLLGLAGDLASRADHSTGPGWLQTAETVVHLAAGTCLRDLARASGRPVLGRAGAEGIGQAIGAQAPDGTARPLYALLRVRQASAYLWGDEPQASAALLTDPFVIGGAACSLRTVSELRAVYQQLSTRWPDLPAVRQLTDRLHTARVLLQRPSRTT